MLTIKNFGLIIDFMKKIILSYLLISWSPSSFANPHLDLLSGHEWKGECRKVINEAGKELKNQPYVRLQSTYSTNGKVFYWWVKSFKDTKCTEIHESRKNTFDCTFDLKDEFAQCKQISVDVSKDEKIWKTEKLSNQNMITSQIKIDRLSENSVKLYMPGESEENPPEVLIK